jgi:hypothetical protein
MTCHSLETVSLVPSRGRALSRICPGLVASSWANFLSDPQGWHHALFLAGLASELVGHLEPNFHRVSLAQVNAVQGHVLMHTVLLLRSDVPA